MAEKNKKIFLLDVFGNLLESLVTVKNTEITMMVVDSCYDADYFKNKYQTKIKNFYFRVFQSNNDFNEFHKTDFNLTYDIVQQYRSTQHKVEQYLHRELLDFNTMQFRYYQALAFWLDFFDKNEIDIVISAHIEHGAIWDTLVYDIAKKKGIPVFIFSVLSASKEEMLTSVVDYLTQSNINIKSFGFRKNNFETYFEKIFNHISSLKKSKESLFLKFKEKFPVQKKISIIENYKKFCSRAEDYTYWYNLYKDEKNEQLFYLKKMKKIYEGLTSLPDSNDKYIYFSMHFEPESVLMVRSIMNSQLILIKWLSEVLPSGWKIYVKEHPVQYSITGEWNYYLRTIQFYRNNEYYKTMRAIPNVKIIPLAVSDDEMLDGAKAVASVSGTVVLKAMYRKKPLILFGKGINVFEKSSDVFVVDSKDTLKMSLEKINGGFVPLYNDCDMIMDKYVFSLPSYVYNKNMPFIEPLHNLLQALVENSYEI